MDAGTYHAIAAGAAGWADYTIREREQLEKTRFVKNAQSFAYLRCGLQLQDDGRDDDARIAYRDAVSADEANVAALLNLAVLDAARGEYPAAIQWLRDAKRAVEDAVDGTSG